MTEHDPNAYTYPGARNLVGIGYVSDRSTYKQNP
jgi:hypothetical protein